MLAPRAWGVWSMDMSLAGGRVQLNALRAILPDGTPLELPVSCPCPPPRDLPVGVDRLSICVAVPALHDQKSNVHGVDVLHPARFRVKSAPYSDVYSDAPPAHLDLGIEEVTLVLTGEPASGQVLLKLAELERDATGQWALSEKWIAPSLRCGASPNLLRLLNSLCDRLSASLAALQPRRELALSTNLAGGEGLVVWSAAIIAGALARLQHVIRVDSVAPERAFEILCSLAGELAVLRKQQIPLEIPALREDELYASFRAVIALIEERLDFSVKTRWTHALFEQRNPTTWILQIDPGLDLERSTLTLCVHDLEYDPTQRRDLINNLKVAHPDQVDEISKRGISGVEIQLLEVPPSTLPAVVNATWFRVRPGGAKWELVVRGRALALMTSEKHRASQVSLYVEP